MINFNNDKVTNVLAWPNDHLTIPVNTHVCTENSQLCKHYNSTIRHQESIRFCIHYKCSVCHPRLQHMETQLLTFAFTSTSARPHAPTARGTRSFRPRYFFQTIPPVVSRWMPPMKVHALSEYVWSGWRWLTIRLPQMIKRALDNMLW